MDPPSTASLTDRSNLTVSGCPGQLLVRGMRDISPSPILPVTVMITLIQ